MERVMGAAIGDMLSAIHESYGVSFHLGATIAGIEATSVTLSSGARLAADLVVVGVGMRPAVTLAARAGLGADRGVVVDEFLRTGGPDIYAAGDIARWPDGLTEKRIRVERRVAARRQGQIAGAQHARPTTTLQRSAALLELGVLNARDALEALLEEVEYEEALLREFSALVTVDSGSICGAKLEEC